MKHKDSWDSVLETDVIPVNPEPRVNLRPGPGAPRPAARAAPLRSAWATLRAHGA